MFKLAFFSSFLVATAFAAPRTPKKVPIAQQVAQARQLYAGGKYDQAAAIYEKIPVGTPEFMRTREELAWSYLRAENWTKLNGLLPDLNTPLVPLRWRLEGRVLSAMLGLRNCQYQQVRRDIEMFQKEVAPLARKVDQKLSRPANAGYWRALSAEISEATFKMKFVRMELRSRLVMLTREQVMDAPKNAREPAKSVAGEHIYPSMSNDVWSDEVFIKQGDRNATCASVHKSKVMR